MEVIFLLIKLVYWWWMVYLIFYVIYKRLYGSDGVFKLCFEIFIWKKSGLNFDNVVIVNVFI